MELHVWKSPDELAAMSREQRELYAEQQRQAVFGVGYRVGRDGRPQEQGIGSPGNLTEQHFAALERAEGAAVAAAARAKAAKAAR